MPLNTVTQIKLLDSRMAMPQYATVGSAGMDLQAALKEPISIYPGDNVMIPTGLAMYIGDPGFVGLLLPKSGKGSGGAGLKNFCGVIDSDYQGEIKANIWNTNTSDTPPIVINPLEKFVQLLIVPVVQAKLMLVNEFATKTLRGTGGFGSTGEAHIVQAIRHCSLCDKPFTDTELQHLHEGSWCRNCMPEVV